jgi:hypothetical protein
MSFFGLHTPIERKYIFFLKLTATITKQLNRKGNQLNFLIRLGSTTRSITHNIAELNSFYDTAEEMSIIWRRKRNYLGAFSYYCYFHNLTELSWLAEATIPVTGDCANAAIRPS